MNGPVTTEFKVDDDFSLYKTGIMVYDHPEPEKYFASNFV